MIIVNTPKINGLLSKIKYRKPASGAASEIIKRSINSHDFLPCFKIFYSEMDAQKIKQLPIPDLHLIEGNIIRGQTLSGKNRKYLQDIKKAGIESVIDLRGTDRSLDFSSACEKNGLKYFSIPIVSNGANSDEIINSLEEFFKIMNEGKCYISCAQGLHRTDIALAINYIFNPKAPKIPPLMHGHIRNNKFHPDNIFRATNNIFKKLSQENKQKLNIENFDEETYILKKKMLSRKNEKYAKHFNQNL